MHKVGIFSGTFDPVHKGHIEAAIVAKATLGLDTVLLFLEKNPKRKQGVADFYHRAQMLELASANFPSLQTIDPGQDNVTTKDTLSFLRQNYPDNEYWLLLGSDGVDHIESWQDSELIFQNMHICIILRQNDAKKTAEQKIKTLQKKYPKTQFKVLPAVWSPVSSSSVKKELLTDKESAGIEDSVRDYIKKFQLYVD